MIDQWFQEDLAEIFEDHSVVVLIDEYEQARFLLDTVKAKYDIYEANSEIEELRIKYLIEKNQASFGKSLIYTQTPRDEQKFIREYCETNGFIEIHDLQNYVKGKVHQTLNLNINLPEENLLAAANISVGKDRSYWLKLATDASADIFDLKKEILTFVHDPKAYAEQQYDSNIRDIFYRRVNDLLGQENIQKPPKTLAKEIVTAMLDGLAYGDCDSTLKAVYQQWIDSVTYSDSFKNYLEKYTLPVDLDLKAVCPAHPFREIDELWMKEISENINDRDYIVNAIAKINRRLQSQHSKIVDISFLEDIRILLQFDQKDIAYLDSFSEVVDFYQKEFFHFDNAIRHLYSEFLNRKGLIAPFQEYYKQQVSVLLDRWFKYFEDYQEEQTGLLQKLIDDNDQKIAVIVGDGITYEFAQEISADIPDAFTFSDQSLLADLPSETENNMSRIYMADGSTEKVKQNREKYLLDHNPDKAIDFINLEDISDGIQPGQYLICTYRDIDNLGEKMQQNALRYFSESGKFISKKISLLLENGCQKVYLISDHGFVLTGLLTEADKITVEPEGDFYKAERYLCTENRQPDLQDRFLEIEKNYHEYKYLYFSKTIHPFKTPGVYGYSHGGASPQELITPLFCWENKKETIESLSVKIVNKDEMESTTGEIFPVKIHAGKGSGNLFTLERKVYLVFFSGNKQINTSDIITINREETIVKEYSFDGNEKVEILLLDAKTKEQLDRATVIKTEARDLGGLL